MIFKLNALKYTFSSNDQSCAKTPFPSLWWKKLTVKIPEFLAQYHTTPVISWCKILAHSDKVLFGVEYLNWCLSKKSARLIFQLLITRTNIYKVFFVTWKHSWDTTRLFSLAKRGAMCNTCQINMRSQSITENFRTIQIWIFTLTVICMRLHKRHRSLINVWYNVILQIIKEIVNKTLDSFPFEKCNSGYLNAKCCIAIPVVVYHQTPNPKT